jgi:transposase
VTIHVGRREGAPARCPCCGHGSSGTHSRYARTLADLPWHGAAVRLRVRSRRMFCENAACERKIFCERLPEIAAHARKTGRLGEALLAIVLEPGGRAGATRLAAEPGLVVGRDAPLSRAKRARSAYSEKVRVLGVDDFAFRRGARYGTILVDLLERHRVADPCYPNARKKESLVAWLERHPGVETATRDRARTSTAGPSPRAPPARRRWQTAGTCCATSPR